MDLIDQACTVEGRREIPMEFIIKWRSLFKLYFAGKNENTIRNYKHDLSRFVAFLWKAKKKYDPAQVDHEDIVDFVTYLRRTRSVRGGEISPKTINRRISALRSFFKFLKRKKIIGENPADMVDLKRVELKVVTEYLTEEEVRALFEGLDDSTFIGLRDKVLLKLYFYTGSRNSEIRTLRYKDLLLDHSHPHFCTKVKGSSLKDSKKRINPDILDELLFYLEERKFIYGSWNEDDFVFHSIKRSDDGKLDGLSIRHIGRIFEKAVSRSGIEKKITPHSARVSLARILYMKTKSVKAVQDVLGHKDIRMTSAYIKRFYELENTPLGESGLFESEEVNLL